MVNTFPHHASHAKNPTFRGTQLFHNNFVGTEMEVPPSKCVKFALTVNLPLPSIFQLKLSFSSRLIFLVLIVPMKRWTVSNSQSLKGRTNFGFQAPSPLTVNLPLPSIFQLKLSFSSRLIFLVLIVPMKRWTVSNSQSLKGRTNFGFQAPSPLVEFQTSAAKASFELAKR